MTKDDILQVLRLTAMGRAGHPLQEQFAEKLAGLFPVPVAHEEPGVAQVVSDIEARHGESSQAKKRKKAE